MSTVPQPIGAPRSHPPPAAFSDGYRRYALSLLLVVYVFNFIDRQILNILAEAIRVDLGLSDTALGFLGGIAFAVFYTFAGIPIARWADRGPRRSIIALGLLVWSAMTAMSGLARSFAHLALARVGVGLGEAACTPPAHSLLSDLYPPERRGTAFSIYALGIPIGSAIGTFAGGWIKEMFDWRTAFFVVGLPGIALAAVVRLTLREPPRPLLAPGASATRETTAAVLGYMRRLLSFRHLSLAAALHAFYGYGAAFFLPVFMIRVHGFSEGELSTYLALIALFAGGLGTFLGGFVCDRLAPRDQRYYVWVPAIATLIGIPFAAALYLSQDRYVALGYRGAGGAARQHVPGTDLRDRAGSRASAHARAGVCHPALHHQPRRSGPRPAGGGRAERPAQAKPGRRVRSLRAAGRGGGGCGVVDPPLRAGRAHAARRPGGLSLGGLSSRSTERRERSRPA